MCYTCFCQKCDDLHFSNKKSRKNENNGKNIVKRTRKYSKIHFFAKKRNILMFFITFPFLSFLDGTFVFGENKWRKNKGTKQRNKGKIQKKFQKWRKFSTIFFLLFFRFFFAFFHIFPLFSIFSLFSNSTKCHWIFGSFQPIFLFFKSFSNLFLNNNKYLKNKSETPWWNHNNHQ